MERSKWTRSILEHKVKIVVVVIWLGFLVRLYALDGRTLYGDEFSTVVEATQLGQNTQALAYFSLLHLWGQLGTSDFWIRLLSVFFGVLTIPAAYRLGWAAKNSLLGIGVAALMAFSPFAIEYAQTTRFYSLYLFVSTLSLAFFVEFLERPDARRFGKWIVVTGITLLSHLFGIFLLLCELGVWWVSSVGGKTRLLRLLSILIIAVGLAILLPQLVNPQTFDALERILGGTPRSTAVLPRGFGMANAAKIPLSFYFFALGQSWYPLDLPAVILGAALVFFTVLYGLYSLRNKPKLLLTILGVLALVPFVFLVVDPAAPAFSETAAPRHVIAALPAMLLLMAVGITSFRYGTLLLIGILLTQGYGLGQYFWGSWSYSIPVQVNWRELEMRLDGQTSANTFLLYDGRSEGAIERYFKAWRKENFWTWRDGTKLEQLNHFDEVVFITNDYRDESRQIFDMFLEKMQAEWTVKSGIVRYPVFAYVFNRKQAAVNNSLINYVTGQIDQPRDVYGLEFQDLPLPISVKLLDTQFRIDGSFAVPSLRDDRERVLTFDTTAVYSGLVLATNVSNTRGLNAGQVVAEVTVETSDGRSQVFVVRMGAETVAWDGTCQLGQSCEVIYSWHKRSALVGQRAYPEAWSDFSARIVRTKLMFETPNKVRRITIRYVAPVGRLNVWAIGLF